MRRFFVVLYAVAVGLHLPFYLLLAALLREPLGAWAHLPAAVVALTLALAFHGRMELARWDRPISRARALAEELYYVHWCALLPWVPLALMMWLLLALDVVALDAVTPGAVALGAGAPWSGWRSGEQALLLAYPPALLLAAWGVVIRRRWVRVRHIPIRIEGLPEPFAGYRIAQLSDLHVGSLCPRRRVERWVDRTNALGVDLVALTGDYVTTGVRFHEDIAIALGKLRGKDGVYAVMGNHDYFGHGQPLMDMLRERDIQLLRNERTYLQRGGARLALAGVDDTYTRRFDADAPFDGHDRAEPLVMLAHDPREFVKLAERGASLVLSGHTHWGQVGMPFLSHRLNYARILMEHHAGLMRHKGAQLYVHPGLGTTGPPVRFGTWPEITVLELQPAK